MDELMTKEEIAIHEAGHATMVLYFMSVNHPVTIFNATVEANELELGIVNYGYYRDVDFLEQLPEEARKTENLKRHHLLAQIDIGGIVAEKIAFNHNSYKIGHKGDLISFGGHLEEISNITDDDEDDLHDELFERVTTVLKENWETVKKVADRLLEVGTLSKEELESIYNEEGVRNDKED